MRWIADSGTGAEKLLACRYPPYYNHSPSKQHSISSIDLMSTERKIMIQFSESLFWELVVFLDMP